MPIRAELLAEIRSALEAAIVPNLTSSSNGADLYEAYIWSLVVQAAQLEGGTVSFLNVFGRRVTSEFVFRTSPGNIYSNRQSYSHALISFPNCPDLEAQVGIFVAGKSGVAHECDVAVLLRSEADICRREGVHPRISQVLLAVECKFYVRTYLGIQYARSFLGLLTDIGRDDRYFVSVSESNRVEKIFAHHKRNFETGLSPIGTKKRHERLRGNFEKIFHNFILKHT